MSFFSCHITIEQVMKDMERWAKSSTTFKVSQPGEASAQKPKGFVPINTNPSETLAQNQTVQAVFANIASTINDAPVHHIYRRNI